MAPIVCPALTSSVALDIAITSLPEWLACRAISKLSSQHATAKEIFKSPAAALDELILVVESGGIDDQYVALSTLAHFSRAKLDPRWSLARRDRLVLALRKHAVERYPDSVARHALPILQIMDYAWLDEFLTGIPLEQVSETDRPKLVYDLDYLRANGPGRDCSN